MGRVVDLSAADAVQRIPPSRPGRNATRAAAHDPGRPLSDHRSRGPVGVHESAGYSMPVMCLNSPELALAPGLSSWPAQVKAQPSRLQLVQHRDPLLR
jgi:hypothetical protein